MEREPDVELKVSVRTDQDVAPTLVFGGAAATALRVRCAAARAASGSGSSIRPNANVSASRGRSPRWFETRPEAPCAALSRGSG